MLSKKAARHMLCCFYHLKTDYCSDYSSDYSACSGYSDYFACSDCSACSGYSDYYNSGCFGYSDYGFPDYS